MHYVIYLFRIANWLAFLLFQQVDDFSHQFNLLCIHLHMFNLYLLSRFPWSNLSSVDNSKYNLHCHLSVIFYLNNLNVNSITWVRKHNTRRLTPYFCCFFSASCLLRIWGCHFSNRYLVGTGDFAIFLCSNLGLIFFTIVHVVTV